MEEMRILVVEDEALIADDLERTLKRLGYRVPAVVSEGEGAINAAAECAPSLVLMDIKLRGRIDGVDAARTIQERCDVPIVFLTSHSDSATLSRASAVRPHGYVMKPFVERDLRVAIEMALHKHEVERTLRARERWFSTILQSVGDGVLATDEKLLVTFMNRVAESLTGWAVRDAVGKHLDEVFQLIDRQGERVESPANEALESGKVVRQVSATLLARGEGESVVVDESAAPIVSAAGHTTGTVVVVRDITARHNLELQVARSERLASLGTMAAGICHEINNPLTCVLANLDFCLDTQGEPGAEGLRESLQDARDAALRIGEIVHDMRIFARVSAEDCKPVDLREVIERSLKFSAHILRQHARVERNLGEAPLVLAEPGRLTQVFINLLVNAAQAIPPGDALSHVVRVSLFTDVSGDAVVEISDDGVGIPPEVLPRIFDPFFTTKGTGAGVGLGLSICCRIIEEQGGEIHARSEVGSGTTFRVRLPRSREGVQGARSPSHPPSLAAGRRGRLLIVDDEESLVRVLARLLSEIHDVEICFDGRTALERLLGPDDYDVVLCDLMMPNMSGMDLFEAVIAARPELAERFLFITGGATTDAARAFLERPDIDVIHKPIFDLAAFCGRIASAIVRVERPGGRSSSRLN